MEKTIEALQKSIESEDFEKAYDILKRHRKERRTETIPIELLVGIIENRGALSPARQTAVDILMVRALDRDKKALQAYLRCLDSRRCRDTSVLTTSALALNPSGKEFVKILPSEIILSLTQDPEFLNRRNILLLLLKLAEEDPNHVRMDILLKAMLIENMPENRGQILKIANTINPVDKLKNIVTIDTLYLMNWIREKRHLHSNETRKLTDEMSWIIKGSEALDLIRNLIVLSRVVDLLLFLVPNKRYRGHDIHQLNVAALGLFLLDVYVSDSLTLKEYIARQRPWRNPEEVEKAWLIAALLHDHAHPLSFMLQIAPSLYAIKGPRESYAAPVEKFEEVLSSTYDNLYSHKLREIYNMFCKGANGLSCLKDLVSSELRKIGIHEEIEMDNILDHGILSAINLTTTLRKFNNSWVDDDEMIKASAKAIAVHNLTQKVSLKNDPIAFLLVLCDEMQEWGREMTLFPEIVIETSSIRIENFKCDEGKNLFFTDELKICFDCPPPRISKKTKFKDPLFKEKKILLKERLVFDPNINPKRLGFDFKSTA